jgi:hypothetical protein
VTAKGQNLDAAASTCSYRTVRPPHRHDTHGLTSPAPTTAVSLAEVDGALATALYAVLDPITGTLDVASAGRYRDDVAVLAVRRLG